MTDSEWRYEAREDDAVLLVMLLAAVERERDQAEARLEAVKALCDEARQVMWPAAKGYPAGWTLDPAAVRAALSGAAA